MLKYLAGILFAAFIIAVSCSRGPSYPSDVEKALEEAGDNRVELEKALEYFASWDDSLKLQAAYYLIGNMEDHSYAVFGLFDSTGNKIDFDASAYSSYDEVVAAADSLESLYGEIDFSKDTLIYDIHSIKGDFLINQIDFAFRAWRTKPWAENLSFDYFLDYVLPYRGSNEPLESWREFFFEKYSAVDTILKDQADAVTVASYINDDVKSFFTFDPRFYYHPTDQGLSEMMENHCGRCEDMANLAIYAMRAVGLAVTSDYTPFWANASGNHAWNALVLPDGEVIPFMGAESNPGKYGLPNKMAKVYRKMFSNQKDNLVFRDRLQEKIPRWLAGKSYTDVTSSYTDVCDVVVNFDKAVPDSVDVAYLCVFNSGEWHAVHWGEIIGDAASFNDMGVGIAYLPALFLNEEIVPYGKPFILEEDCSLRKLIPDVVNPREINLGTVTGRRLAVATDGVHEKQVQPGDIFELFYWDDGWQSLGQEETASQGLIFRNMPGKCLYWLVAEDSDRDERIFTIEDNKQVWW